MTYFGTVEHKRAFTSGPPFPTAVGLHPWLERCLSHADFSSSKDLSDKDGSYWNWYRKKPLKAAIKEAGTPRPPPILFLWWLVQYRLSPLHMRGARTSGFSTSKLLLSDSLQWRDFLGKLQSVCHERKSIVMNQPHVKLICPQTFIPAPGGNLSPLLGSQWWLDILLGQYSASTLQVGDRGKLHILRKIQDFTKSVKVMLLSCWTKENSLTIEKKHIQ